MLGVLTVQPTYEHSSQLSAARSEAIEAGREAYERGYSYLPRNLVGPRVMRMDDGTWLKFVDGAWVEWVSKISEARS